VLTTTAAALTLSLFRLLNLLLPDDSSPEARLGALQRVLPSDQWDHTIQGKKLEISAAFTKLLKKTAHRDAPKVCHNPNVDDRTYSISHAPGLCEHGEQCLPSGRAQAPSLSLYKIDSRWQRRRRRRDDGETRSCWRSLALR
jgi:hypothetical protein